MFNKLIFTYFFYRITNWFKSFFNYLKNLTLELLFLQAELFSTWSPIATTMCFCGVWTSLWKFTTLVPNLWFQLYALWNMISFLISNSIMANVFFFQRSSLSLNSPSLGKITPQILVWQHLKVHFFPTS